MNLRNLFYQTIYYPPVNAVLRRMNRIFQFLAPGLRIPVSGRISFNLQDGTSIIMETNQTDYVSKLIYYDGVYSYEYVDIFEKIIEKCQTFVDVGSNAGLYSLIAGVKRKNKIKVLAFDPSLAASHFVPKNISLNNIQDTVLFNPIALSDKAGEMSFFEVTNRKYPFEKYNLGGASSLINVPDESQENKVCVSSFDLFAKENSLDKLQIDLVKIDAEGAEPNIISGMRDTISRYKPIIICEILFDNMKSALDEEIAQHGYKTFLHSQGKLHEVTGTKYASNFDAHNCFLVPDEKRSWIEPFLAT